MNCENRVAVVTGSSTGIGAATAIQLASSGFDIVLHGRRRSTELDSVCSAIQDLGRNFKVVTCDFSKTDTLPEFCEQCWSSFDGVHALVNNAGGDVLTGDRAADDFESKLQYLLQVDVVATLLLSREFGARMKKHSESANADNGEYSVINIGWDQAEQGMAGDAGEMFATTKGAVMSLTRSLAQSLAPAVRVNCVAPGWIQTEWGMTASDDWQRRAIGNALMKRWGEVGDVANTIAFLVSPEASFISGQIINVNGGFEF